MPLFFNYSGSSVSFLQSAPAWKPHPKKIVSSWVDTQHICKNLRCWTIGLVYHMSFHCGLTDCRCQCPLLVKSCPVPVKQLKPNQNYHQSPWAPLCLFDPLRARRDAQSSHHAEGRVGRQRAKPLLILVGDFAGCFFLQSWTSFMSFAFSRDYRKIYLYFYLYLYLSCLLYI